MERTLFSRHIPKVNTNHMVLCDDIRMWNNAMHWAFCRVRKDENILKTSAEPGKPDMRKKENRHLLETQPDSLHVQVKKKYGLNDYFANSIVNASKGAYRSVKELRKDNIAEIRKKQSAVKDRLRKKEKFLAGLERLKKGCRDLSLWKKNGSSGKKPRLRLPTGGTISFDYITAASS